LKSDDLRQLYLEIMKLVCYLDNTVMTADQV